MTPSSCHGVVELPGKKKCQEMLTLSAVSASRGDDLLIPSQVHELVVVGQDRGRRRAKNGDFGTWHGAIRLHGSGASATVQDRDDRRDPERARR